MIPPAGTQGAFGRTPTNDPNTLEVFVNDVSIGVLSRDGEQFFDFHYSDRASPDQAVSLTMPITEDPDEYVEFGLLPASFQVSLPEGVVMERLRSLYKKDINMDDPFDLLRLVGRNGIGRVTFGGKRSLAPVEVRDALLRDARSASAAQRLWNDLDRLGPEAFGVSGAMPKMLIDAHLATESSPGERPATLLLPSHIVKFDDAQHYGASLLEYACMSVCQRLGFRIPDLELAPSGDALIVQRFDMSSDGRYLGFEDACALSGYQRNQKYQGSVEELFDMAKTFIPEARQEEAIRDLTRMVLVNDALRNGDAHLKNFALLYDHPDDAYWSPVYDVLNTTMFIPDDRPALSWDVEREVDQVWLDDSRALDVLCRLSGQDGATLKAACRLMGDDLRASIADVVHGMRELPLDHDRRIFVDGLPEYFDNLLAQNSLFQHKTATLTQEKQSLITPDQHTKLCAALTATDQMRVAHDTVARGTANHLERFAAKKRSEHLKRVADLVDRVVTGATENDPAHTFKEIADLLYFATDVKSVEIMLAGGYSDVESIHADIRAIAQAAAAFGCDLRLDFDQEETGNTKQAEHPTPS
jgi:serine/threonine-protein kinase HipA